LITPSKDLKLGQGVITSINIAPIFDSTAFSLIPVGLVSLALVRNCADSYAVYQNIYNDISNIAQSGFGVAPSRLWFASEIYGALSPKTIPFRDGSISYGATGFTGTPPGPEIPVDGGYNYYMYIPSDNVIGYWATQVPAAAYSNEAIATAYIKAMNALAGNETHNKIFHTAQLGSSYLKDGSAFASNSPYYGQGGGISASPYSSTELEVPFKAPALGVLTMFNPAIPRSSRVLNITTGDACCNYAMGALQKIPLSYYNSAITPVFKFIDVTEIVASMLFSLAQALEGLYRSQNPPDDDIFLICTAGLGCTYTQFFIAVLQQLKWMFSDSQCLAQFMCPQTSSGGFQSFLCGSNTYPKGPGETIIISTFLNENLRMLLMAEHPYNTKNFNDPRNKLIYIPVLGTFKGYVPPDFFGTNIDTQFFPFFEDENTDPNTPNIFDGTSGNYVVDFNSTPGLSNIIAYWNSVMTISANQWASTCRMGGSGTGGPLLQYTRYCSFVSANENKHDSIVKPGQIVPKHMRRFIHVREVEQKSDVKLVRSLSKEKEKPKVVTEKVMAPPNSTLYTQYSLGYSSIVIMTATLKEYAPDLILPVIEIVPGALPGIAQYQTSVREVYSLLFNSSTIYNNRATEIVDSVSNSVTGLAGHKTELATYVETLSKANIGGFLGDLFSTIGSVAGVLGAPGVGAVANTLGGVANAIGI